MLMKWRQTEPRLIHSYLLSWMTVEQVLGRGRPSSAERWHAWRQEAGAPEETTIQVFAECPTASTNRPLKRQLFISRPSSL